MRRFLLVLLISQAACVDRDRLNSTCLWSDDLSSPLDLSRKLDRRHLREDALIAEELGVRHGDVFRRTRSVAERDVLRAECTGSLFDQIARTHGVTQADVLEAGSRRDTAIDIVAVMLPMLLLLVFAAGFAADRVQGSFDSEEVRVASVATVLFAPVIAVLWLAVGSLWTWMVESLRLRDDHLSFRAARMPWDRNWVVLFGAGILVFLLVAWRRKRRGRPPERYGVV